MIRIRPILSHGAEPTSCVVALHCSMCRLVSFEVRINRHYVNISQTHICMSVWGIVNVLGA